MVRPLDQVESFYFFVSNFLEFVPILAQILEKIDSLSIYIRRLILLPMLAARPRRVFCNESTPTGWSHLYMLFILLLGGPGGWHYYYI